MDILLCEELDSYSLDRTVYVDSVEEEVEGDVAHITYFYHEVKRQLDELLNKNNNNPYVNQAVHIFQMWPRKLELNVVQPETIFEYVKDGVLDLSDKYIPDLDMERLGKKWKESRPIVNLFAERAFFSGKRISFDGTEFIGFVSFKGCIFKGETLSFQNAHFTLNESDRSFYDKNEVTFRNSHLFVRNLLMDGCLVDGDAEEKIVSFEDAVIDATYISFSKMVLGNAKLFCYQTLMGNAEIYMVEPAIGQGRLDFEDSLVKSIILLNASEIPQTQFGFRACERLVIENCNITDNIFMDNMKVLSLRACRNQGKILTNWRPKVKDDASKNRNYPILLSVIHNQDSDEIKAEQFIILKENFASIGQYDYEDEAFIQYMNYKSRKSPIRIAYGLLNCIGKYGISPARVFLTMFWTVLVFGLVYFGLGYLMEDAFTYETGVGGVWSHLVNAVYYSISNLISYDCGVKPGNFLVIVLSMTESMFGWFLLGYLSVAIVRKTLR